ncbi:MAG: hypothetical protein KatS3mg028_0041 [Bacteroidia bacterium]|nr:MAG: hypothetical protein KatS3mg028_0041 [Bacteroidia bacterium]
MMKVVLLTDGIYPFVIGGMQRHSYFLAKYLAQRKVYVRVYHCIQRERDKHEEVLKQIFTEDELTYLEFVEIPFDFTSRFPGYYILESYRYSKRIYNHLIRDIHDFDFVYSKGFTAWYLLKQKKNDFPKVGIKLHGYEMYQYAPDWKVKLQHLLLRIPAAFVTKQADIVFSYGGKITDIVHHVLKVPLERIVEIPTGIEKSLVQKSITEYHRPLKFVFIGRYEKRKGIENLNAALNALIGEKTDFEFDFIGDIPEALQIRNNRIVYHGKVTEYSKIQEILRGCDVLVCPSYSEGMPNVIVEAMANGLTVIATDVGSVSLLVNEKTGFLLKDNHPFSIEQMMKKIIGASEEVIQSKKSASLQHVENFVWEKVINDVMVAIKKFSLPR